MEKLQPWFDVMGCRPTVLVLLTEAPKAPDTGVLGERTRARLSESALAEVYHSQFYMPTPWSSKSCLCKSSWSCRTAG